MYLTSRKSTFKKSLIVISSIALAIGLTSCGAGPDAATRMIKQVTDGVDVDLGAIKIRTVLIVAQPNGAGTLVASIVNQGSTPDELKKITINGAEVNFTVSKVLAQNVLTSFEGRASNASAVVPVLNAVTGSRVEVIFSFALGGDARVSALIVEKSGIYANVGDVIP